MEVAYNTSELPFELASVVTSNLSRICFELQHM